MQRTTVFAFAQAADPTDVKAIRQHRIERMLDELADLGWLDVGFSETRTKDFTGMIRYTLIFTKMK